MDERKLYAATAMPFLTDSYKSSVSSGDFSLLTALLQGLLGFAYMNLRQLETKGGQLAAALPTSMNSTTEVAGLIITDMTEQVKGLLIKIPGDPKYS